MHTDITLDIQSQATTSLGQSIREFQDQTCTMFQTRELERERAARQRRQEKNHKIASTSAATFTTSGNSAVTAAGLRLGPQTATSGEHTRESTRATNGGMGLTSASASHHGTGELSSTASQRLDAAPKASGQYARKPKSLGLKTYTYHALGDYVETIRLFGTTDSFSTQPVSLQLNMFSTSE
jgi:hypothetical protein